MGLSKLYLRVRESGVSGTVATEEASVVVRASSAGSSFNLDPTRSG